MSVVRKWRAAQRGHALPVHREFARPYAEGIPLTRKPALTLEILRAYVGVRWSLRTKEFQELVAAIRDRNRDVVSPHAADALIEARQLGWIVSRVLDMLPSDSRCLTRSLVLMELLARRGVGSSLIIGVASEPEFAAHAWVEIGGEQLLPAREGKFSRLTEL